MNWLDIAIVAFLAIGVLFGYMRGLIRLLVPELAVIAAAAALYRRPDLVHRIPEIGSPALRIFLVLLAVFLVAVILSGYVTAILHLVPGLRGIDHLAGAGLNLAVGFVTVYSAVVAMVSFDSVVQPINDAVRISAQQVQALRALVKQNPQFSWFIDDAQLARLASEAGPRGVSTADLGYYDFAISGYEHQLRPQLVTSRLVPAVLQVGQRLPIIGRPGLRQPKP